ncbi:MAG: GntR family transcriptional regulator [Blastocatellia bacterium]|nr:GntR family transcriptional regulator [Blastocatellia bacterium]
MHLWLSKTSDVPLREQITTQIMLAIVSGDLKPGHKLPSTRELARRFSIHPNTVSAAYQDMAARRWVEFRKGSGVYVRELHAMPTVDKKFQLDHIISTFLGVARQAGFSVNEIRSSVRQWLELQAPDRFLVIEEDPELRALLVAEIMEATQFPTVGAGVEACTDHKMLTDAAPVALYGMAEKIRTRMAPDTACLFLNARSIHKTLPIKELSQPDALVTVVSHWPDFLKWARTTLVAAGIDELALNFRDTREDNWQLGLERVGLIITESLTAKLLPKACQVWVYHLLADSSLDELNQFVERFLS